MRELLYSTALVLLGFAAGWYLKPQIDISEPLVEELSHSTSPNQRPNTGLPSTLENNGKPELTYPINNTELAQRTSEKQAGTGGSSADFFLFLLSQRSYRQAMDYYQDIERRDSALAAALKTKLLALLKTKLNSMELEHFNGIAEAWLATYFNDIDVLLLLAEYNSVQDYYGEAVSVYQLAHSYAKNDVESQKTRNAIFQFLVAKDALLAEKQDWYTLQYLYELVEQAGIAESSHYFRLAEIYLHNGYKQKSRELAEQLLGHHRLSAKAKKLIEQIDGNDADFQPSVVAGRSVPLTRMGAHYLTEVTFPGDLKLQMILDTGATTTAISPEYLPEIYKSGKVHLLQRRLFNTANGVVRGDVFVVTGVEFAGYNIENLEVAVLPIEAGHNIAGLLGMDILSQFKFHIDQANAELVLEHNGE